MNRYLTTLLFTLLVVSSTCATDMNSLLDSTNVGVKTDSLNPFDRVRNRLVPLALYMPETSTVPLKLAVISHGYGGKNKAYWVYLQKGTATADRKNRHELAVALLISRCRYIV